MSLRWKTGSHSARSTGSSRPAEAEKTAQSKAEEEKLAGQRRENCARAKSHAAALDSGLRMGNATSLGLSLGDVDGDGYRETPDGKSLSPMMAYGIQAMSIGFLIDVETPMVWRGPMVTSALEQLLTETRWDEVDYLVIDMPPGTGDIQLTLAQKVPVTGAVIVTTPQDIALLDARKGLKMFEKVGIPILGIVENMSIHTCSKCGHEEHIFGEGGGARMAADYGLDVLGSLPLAMQIREQADSGKPTVVSDPDGRVAEIYRDIARKVAVKIADKGKDMSAKFPSIVVQNT